MSTRPQIDLGLVRERCYSAVVSDCCDAVGLRDRALDPRIVPLVGGERVLAGWARPVVSMRVEGIPPDPYATEIAYIDSLGPDEVVVATCESGAAFWGELFSTAARARGATGAVVDGLVRDSARIDADEFSVHARGTHPTDSLGRSSIAPAEESATVGGVRIARGDLIVADVDGIVAVPLDAVQEVVARALRKAAVETQSRAMLAEGALLRDAWDTHGVL